MLTSDDVREFVKRAGSPGVALMEVARVTGVAVAFQDREDFDYEVSVGGENRESLSDDEWEAIAEHNDWLDEMVGNVTDMLYEYRRQVLESAGFTFEDGAWFRAERQA